MNFFQKKYTISTYVKYFFSYLIISSILLMGFFYIVRNQLTELYFAQRCNQAKIQLDNMAEQLNDEVSYLLQVDGALRSNMELLMERYKTAESRKYTIYHELGKYASTTRLISSIIYMQKRNDSLFSTQLAVTYEEGIFHITNSLLKTITFDPSPYFDAGVGQLAFISNEEVQYLLYFPSTSAEANYIFFYVLDVSYLQQRVNAIATDEMPAIALIDADKRIVTGTDSSRLMPYLDSMEFENGIYQADSSVSLCTHTGIRNGFSMVSLLSNDFLNAQINTAFANSYLSIMVLTVACFFLILLAMRITYLPLYRLTRKLVPNLNSRQNFLNQLEYTFLDMGKQNQSLKDKLENYRISMQKSLLDSILVSQHADMAAALPNIDQFFDMAINKEIFIIRISAPSEPSWADIQKLLSDALPDSSACIMLESEGRNALFLINYIGDERNKKEMLQKLLCNYYEEKGFLSAISNGSDSPMDIPALYENVMYASNYWPRIPVAEFDALPPVSATYAYPYDALNLLSESLTENDFSAARQVISDIFHIADLHMGAVNHLPNFFVQCILIDMLTIIANYMNLSYLKFHDYSELYFETLYFCRSCPYQEKAKQIQANIETLIHFCEQEISQKLITSMPFIQMIEECYCQPDFSISVLADKFHVSVAYMSQLFKKEMNVNFSDYLWRLRLKKARELLCTTNLSIDDISIAVGYYNASSFRRKFKQETGLSPSQFRTDFQDPESLKT